MLAAELPVLVCFSADWCPPCRMLAPVLAAIAAEQPDRVRVVSVNVDHNPASATAYQVLSTPTLIVFRSGQPVRSLVGARSKLRLLEAFADLW